MKAIKDNKIYTIATKAEAESYKAAGYDIYDDGGRIKAYADGKTVPFGKYAALEKKCAELEEKNAALEDKNAELLAELEKLQKTKSEKGEKSEAKK